MEDLLQEQPLDDLRRRLPHRPALQYRHHAGAARRIHRLYAHRNMDTTHHHLRAGGLFRYRAGKTIDRQLFLLSNALLP